MKILCFVDPCDGQLTFTRRAELVNMNLQGIGFVKYLYHDMLFIYIDSVVGKIKIPVHCRKYAGSVLPYHFSPKLFLFSFSVEV